MKRAKVAILTILLMILVWSLAPQPAVACGGLFCQTSPVDQNAERIIFSDNGDGTITTLVQIQYTGSAPDFSWILPLPSAISNDDIAVPDGADAAFTELELATNPRYIPPPLPACAEIAIPDMVVESSEGGGVEIFASGEVGPFGFVVIGSEDPDALLNWLRDNEYRVEPAMEPLIDVYVEEQMVFLAMRLLPGEDADSITPIEVTYRAERPMIPLRLTAVAANPDMAVLVWFFGEAPVRPENYAHMEIPDEAITFWDFGGNNYRSLVSRYANEHNGQAFITEYAQPTANLAFNEPLLNELAQKHRYLSRLNTVISPEEMTLDPVFAFDSSLPDVSNVHDLSETTGQYECERAAATSGVVAAVDEVLRGEEAVAAQNDPLTYQPSLTARLVTGGAVLLCVGLVLGAAVVGVFLLGRSSLRSE